MIKEDLVVGFRDVNHRVSNFLVTVDDIWTWASSGRDSSCAEYHECTILLKMSFLLIESIEAKTAQLQRWW